MRVTHPVKNNLFSRVFHKVLILLFLVSSRELSANVLILPPSLSDEVLSESVPTAFSPNHFDVLDFDFQWVSHPIPDLQVQLAKGSLQWVRVREVLVLPRARLVVDVQNVQGGEVSSSGFSQPLIIDKDHDKDHGEQSHGHAEIPIALLSGDKNPILISVKRGDQVLRGKIQVQFKPGTELQNSDNHVYVDSSCSPFSVSVESLTPSLDDWIYLGCRQVRAMNQNSQTASLEIFSFWDNVGQTIQVGGVETQAASPSMWPLRLQSQPGQVLLQGKDHKILLHYKIAQTLHAFSLSMGVGGYSHGFTGGGEDFSNFAVFGTLYGSYFIAEDVNVVGFGLTALDSHNYTDVGLYLKLENNRFLDRRASLNLLIGGHAMGFKAQGQYYLVFSAPQGFELIYRDAFQRGRNLAAGAFIYPSISGSAYYNIWLRWGKQLFGEVNYIAWQAQPNTVSYSSNSLGITFGFPLARFW